MREKRGEIGGRERRERREMREGEREGGERREEKREGEVGWAFSLSQTIKINQNKTKELSPLPKPHLSQSFICVKKREWGKRGSVSFSFDRAVSGFE